MAEFDVARRERVLALLKVGLSVGEACAEAGVNPATVWRWRTRGLAAGASPECAEFAQRFDELRVGRAERATTDAKATPRRGERETMAEKVWRMVQNGDPFVALEPASMALLTPEQQERAREVAQAKHDEYLARRRRNGQTRGCA